MFYGPKIGFIGLGFVGNAIATSYTSGFDIKIRDPEKGHNASWDELKECEGILTCLKTP